MSLRLALISLMVISGNYKQNTLDIEERIDLTFKAKSWKSRFCG